jgi:hypothetical protein
VRRLLLEVVTWHDGGAAKCLTAPNQSAQKVLDAFDIFDAEVSDIDSFYTSRLPGEPAHGVSASHTHPAQPRSIGVGLQMSF